MHVGLLLWVVSVTRIFIYHSLGDRISVTDWHRVLSRPRIRLRVDYIMIKIAVRIRPLG